MSDVPPDVTELLLQRDQARAAKDFARADALREQIAGRGFAVRDTPDGGIAEPVAQSTAIDPATVSDRLSEPAAAGFSIHVLYEGFREDVSRFVESFARHCRDYEIVVTDAAHPDGEWLDTLADDVVRVLHFDRDPGWAAGRNAAINDSRGRIVAIADLSVQPTGDLLTPIANALADPAVGIAGPWGLTTTDLRAFEESTGPVVDAIQGYFLAMRRDTAAAVRFDEKFKWYRHADIDLSFQIRALGLAAVATTAPAVRHPHRAWEALPEEVRAKRSKRNFYRFLDRFKDRTDLIEPRGAARPTSPPD